MPTLPAYCQNCDRWFPSALELEKDAKHVTLEGINMQCAKCGGVAPIISGVYTAIGDTIEIIKSHDLNEKELKKLSRILQQAIALNTPAGQIRDLIEKEVPRAAGINKFIDDKRGLIAILMLLLQVLAFAMPYLKSPSNNDDLNTEKIVNAILSQKPKEEPTSQVSRKVGVNELCWCGSGKKRKKCHRLQSRPNAPRNLNQKPK